MSGRVIGSVAERAIIVVRVVIDGIVGAGMSRVVRFHEGTGRRAAPREGGAGGAGKGGRDEQN